MSIDKDRMSFDLSYFVEVVSGKRYNKEPDTYSFILRDDNSGGYVIHDQSGWTCEYRRWPEYDKDVITLKEQKEAFATWMTWDSTKRRKWRQAQLEAKEKPMSLTCTPAEFLVNQPQSPINNNRYIQYVEDPCMIDWNVDTLQDELDFINDIIENDDFDDKFFEDNLKEKRLLEEAIYYFKSKGNNKMYATSNTAIVAAAQPESIDQRSYLLARLRDVDYKKERELHATFKLNPVKGPTTLKDLVQKIKDGDYTLFDDDSDERDHWSTSNLVDNIRWTKDKPDRKGYDAAIALKKDAFTKTTDAIKILSPEEGLKALQAFEAQTFH